MASAVEYAQWITANKDKKGTPEFEKVAKAYQVAKLRGAASSPTGEGSPAQSIQKNVMTGIANLAGAPVDLGSLALSAVGRGEGEQAGGSENLKRLGANIGLTYPSGEEPQDFGSRFFRELGSSGVPLAAGLMRGKKVLESGKEAKGIIDRITSHAAKSPGKTLAAEGAAIAGAAAGGTIAQKNTDNPAIIAISELAGGLTPGAVAGLPGAAMSIAKHTPVAGAAIRGVQSTVLPFTKEGGKIIAGKRLQSIVEDSARAEARLSGADLLPGVRLSPARTVGEPRLLALERAILDENPALDLKFSEELAQANQQTRMIATEFQGDPARTKKLLAQRRDHVLSLVDTRAAQASRKAQEAVAALGPDATERQISIAVREKITGALSEARTTEKQLWADVGRDVPADLSTANEKLAEILASRSSAADPDDLPRYVGALAKKKDVTTGFLTDFRSRLLADASQARSAGQSNKGRILGDMAEAVLEDLGKIDDPAAQAARDFSRKLNDKFTRGRVGEMLGYSADRGLRVDPSETLAFIDQGKDIARANHLVELVEAEPSTRPAVGAYLRGAFVRQATDGGTVNPAAAKRFLGKYQEALAMFPDVKQSIDSALAASSSAAFHGQRAAKVTKSLGNTRMSRTALYLDGTVGDEWRRVLNSDDPVAAAKELAKQVRTDRDAIQGLKQGFVEELLRRSETSAVDEAGQAVVSGKKFRRLVSDNGKVVAGILSGEEQERLRKVTATFARIEAAPGNPEKIMTDHASNFVDFVASYLGAKHAGKIAGKDRAASLVIAARGASMFRRIAGKLTFNKARSLVVGAVDDPELYRALLVGPTDSVKRQEDAISKINAWLVVPATPDQEANGK